MMREQQAPSRPKANTVKLSNAAPNANASQVSFQSCGDDNEQEALSMPPADGNRDINNKYSAPAQKDDRQNLRNH